MTNRDLAPLAHNLLLTEPLVENNNIEGFACGLEAGCCSCLFPGCSQAASRALAASRSVAAAKPRKSRGRTAKSPTRGLDSSRSQTGFLRLLASPTPI